MTRRVFWQNVAANLVSAAIGGVVLLVVYRFWFGKLPSLEDVIS